MFNFLKSPAIRFTFLSATSFICVFANAFAHEYKKPDNINDIFANSSHYLGFAIARYDVIDEKQAAEVKLEYSFGEPILGPFKPILVAELTEDASFYAGAGLYIDYLPHKNIYIKPSWTIGVYEEGQGKDLGDGAIIRSQLELGYQFDTLHRLGIAFSHASNAMQDKNNTGTEVLSLYFHMPTENLFSRNRNGNTRILKRQ
jgi:hypothetical protein